MSETELEAMLAEVEEEKQRLRAKRRAAKTRGLLAGWCQAGAGGVWGPRCTVLYDSADGTVQNDFL